MSVLGESDALGRVVGTEADGDRAHAGGTLRAANHTLHTDQERIGRFCVRLGQRVRALSLEVVKAAVERFEVRVAPRAARAGAHPRRAFPRTVQTLTNENIQV